MQAQCTLFRPCVFLLALSLGGCISLLSASSTPTPIRTSGPIFKSSPFHPVSVVNDNGCVTVNFAADCGTVTITVLDMDGNPVYQTSCVTAAGASFYIDASGWNGGSYEVEVTSAAGSLCDSWIDVPQ